MEQTTKLPPVLLKRRVKAAVKEFQKLEESFRNVLIDHFLDDPDFIYLDRFAHQLKNQSAKHILKIMEGSH